MIILFVIAQDQVSPRSLRGNKNGEAKGLASPRIELAPISSALDAYLPPPSEWT
jgi:hypothetical protein